MTKKIEARDARALVVAALAAAVVATGCGDDSGGTGGAGGDATTAATTVATSTSTTSTDATTVATSTSTGEGGGTGGAGTGGAGTGASACLDAADFADLLALDTDRLCVVARYDAPGWSTSSYGIQPTWGRHGGPLTGAYDVAPGTGQIVGVSLTRWTAPEGVAGELLASAEGESLDLGADALYGGAQIVDLDDTLTAFAFTGADFATQGGVVFFDASGQLEVDLLIGGFGLGLAASNGYLLYTALAALGTTEAGAAGLYGGSPCDEGGLFCGGFAYETWGDATGSLTVDAAGNTFAVMTSFDGTQTARGFGAAQIGLGAATEGVDLFTIDGFGTPLAALAPAGAADGLLVYQATDGETFAQDPAILVPYTAGEGFVAPEGEPEPLLTPAAEGAPVSIVADDEGRLWVGVGTDEGTTFVVLARPSAQ